MQSSFVKLEDGTLININMASLIDSVGNESNTYRVYHTVSGDKVLWISKKNQWLAFNKPDPSIVAKMNSMRSKDDPRSPFYGKTGFKKARIKSIEMEKLL